MVPTPESIRAEIEMRCEELLKGIKGTPCDDANVSVLRDSICEKVKVLMNQGDVYVSTHYNEIYLKQEIYQILPFLPYVERYIILGTSYRLFVDRKHVANVVYGPPAPRAFEKDGTVNLGYSTNMRLVTPAQQISFTVEVPNG